MYLMSRKIKASGIKMVLSGEGESSGAVSTAVRGVSHRVFVTGP